ncbi:hypothetical protein DWV13_01370 [Clostridium botulinum]|uniref:arylsulfotransferase family protein n=1 Tax=Clostridium TaxID=1485 RepID=UPI0013FB242C|nr:MULTISPECIES: arylsulfotransferase family protein [Clostridium]MCS6130314.1 hypothetical protein [Clostridium botulinum]NFL46705.1 hypothetical protein [Clostridium botulinum]NFL91151.1 hypothetical protein [Clostridium botulinum]
MKKRKPILIIISLILITLGGFFIYNNYFNKAEEKELLEVSDDNTVYINMLFNGFKPYRNDDSNYFNLNLLKTDMDNIIEFQDFDGKIYINNEKVNKSKPYKLSVKEISKDNNIQVTFIKNSGEKSEIYLRTLPDKYPEISSSGESPYEGEYYLSTYYNTPQGNYIFKINNTGKLTFYKETTGFPFNFTKVVAGDKIRYCYLEESLIDTPLENIGYRPCELVVLDENYTHLKTIRAKGNGILPDNAPLENHDYIYIDDNHYIVSSYVSYSEKNIPKEVYSGEGSINVVSAVIQEILDDEVVFQWQSSDHPELYINSYENNEYNFAGKTLFDYCHLNSFTIDPKDNNLVCSFRNLDSILKIDRKSGDILWTLGGKGDEFNLDKKTEHFSRQHYVKVISENTLLFFDNESQGNPASALELSLDENTKSITSYKRYSPIKRPSSAMGSAQLISRENDVILINYGSISDHMPLFVEKDFKNNKELFSFSYKDGLSAYRVQKYK